MASRSSPQWTSWDGLDEANQSRVRSEPLAGRCEVQNRRFPKIRSWIALGAPLELLSPLSVLRFVVPLTTLGAAAVVVEVLVSEGGNTGAAGVATAGLLGLCLYLTRARQVSARATEIAGLLAATGTVLAGHAGGGLFAASWATFALALISLVMGLFARPRVIGGFALAVGLGEAVVWSVAGEASGAAVTGIFFGLLSCLTAYSTWFLARSARRRGEVDADTGLPNGYGLARRFASSFNEREGVAVAVVSLGGLDGVREALGYQVATEVLRRVVEDLGQVVPAGSVIGRVSGDELVVVTQGNYVDGSSDVLPAGAARNLAAALWPAVSAGRYVVNDIELRLRPHVGLALAPWHAQTLIDTVRCASLSAARAKAEGVDEDLWDGQSTLSLTKDDLALLADLRQAAERGELMLHYQPQIDARSGKPISVEALIRWQSPVHGFVSPGRFIPLAERTGLVDRLTDWVLGEALDAQLRWRDRGLRIPTGVNISALTLSRSDLNEWISGELASRELPGDALVFELTETAPTADLFQAISLLRPLHERGVHISIDDFGTGYTSLSALPALSVSELKIDQSFVRRVVDSDRDLAIVQAMCDLAHRLGMRVVAEGVETEAMRDLIVECGADVLQGFFYSRPLAEEQLLEYLRPAQPVRLPVPTRAGNAGMDTAPAYIGDGEADGLTSAHAHLGDRGNGTDGS